VLAALRRSAGHVTPVGRALLLLLGTALLVTRLTGLAEFAVIGWLSALLLAVGLPFVLLPTRTRGHLLLRSTRTVVGELGVGTLHVTNHGALTLRRPVVDVPVGERPVTVRLPLLRPGRDAAEPFDVPAYRRGLLTVGPAHARRTDPLGLYRRSTLWAPAVELLVRPRMVALESLTPGNAQDLDGAPSDQVSMSDLAFHALREYVRGDDLRHVHWRSSARAGQLHVRQYHDSRRSRALVLLDDDAAAYPGADAFELAVSLAASVLVRLTQDAYDASLVCGDQRIVSGSVDDLLDATCRVTLRDAGDLLEAGQDAAALVGGASLVLLVTGDRVDPQRLRVLRGSFAHETAFVVLLAGRRTEEREPPTGLDDLPAVLRLTALDALPPALAAVSWQGVLA